jgi:hypothetical protein
MIAKWNTFKCFIPEYTHMGMLCPPCQLLYQTVGPLRVADSCGLFFSHMFLQSFLRSPKVCLDHFGQMHGQVAGKAYRRVQLSWNCTSPGGL